MLIELGHLAAIAAFITSVIQFAAGFWPRGNAQERQYFAIELATPVFVLLSFAFFTLIASFVTSDFTVLNVAENSHRLKPLLYKIAGAWGNHEGSVLFFVWVLSLYAFLFRCFDTYVPTAFRARVLNIQALIGASFMGYMLFASNPFARQFPAPREGHDLNPLLQDPGLVFHPPLLYLGYVGFSLTFALAFAALFDRGVTHNWAKIARPWALLSWSFLTCGIALGSWWAYYELGWGGFWFWDPVENASLMPWLLGTALVHSLIVTERRDSFKPWTVLLALLTFIFSLLGTFLVRSGILTSVHAFANDPTRGIYLLAIIATLSGLAFILYGLRAAELKNPIRFGWASRESGIQFNNLFLTVCCATVCLGTLYPLILDLGWHIKVSVGPPYFAFTFVPLAVPIAILAGLAPSVGGFGSRESPRRLLPPWQHPLLKIWRWLNRTQALGLH